MSLKKTTLIFIVAVSLLTSSVSLAQEAVRIAVAANFLATLNSLAKDFTEETGVKVTISSGSSGMLFAQIKRGAPHDLFFSADAKRPKLLEAAGVIEPNSRFTYVTGNLVAWSPNPSKISADLTKLTINDPNLRFLAIANPRTAPYGMAAVEVLRYYGLYDYFKENNKIALGGSVSKAFKYVFTRNAQIGLIAKSYVLNPNRPIEGEIFDIPSHLYTEIKQQAVIIKGRKTPAVIAFLDFFHSERAQTKIKSYGYGIPNFN